MKRLAHYSQYFLRKPQLVNELIGHSLLKKTDIVYDIGAGSGIISAMLAKKVAQVIAVEVESRMVNKLSQNLNKYNNVTIYNGSFLDMPTPKNDYAIFANIPFHLSSPIIRHITFSNNPPQKAYFIVQKQFANKLLPSFNGFTGQLGMLAGAVFTIRVRKTLKKTDFWPHPNVDTVFIECIKRKTPLVPQDKMQAYYQFTADCFSDPKKFAKIPTHKFAGFSDKNPSQFTLEQWVTLFNNQKIYK